MPILVLHGLNDPLIPVAHGKKLAAVLPAANAKWIPDMGHDIPNDLIAPVEEELIQSFSE